MEPKGNIGIAPLEKEFLSLNKGIITEFPPLSQEEGSTRNEENFELNSDGSRQRRKGLNIEPNYVDYTYEDLPLECAPFTNSTFVSYRWTNVANDPNTTFIVVKLGTFLHFYEENSDLSLNKKSFTLDLRSLSSCGDSPGSLDLTFLRNKDLVFSQGQGHLFISSPCLETTFVEYDPATDSIESSTIEVRIRDFVGVSDNINNETMPTGALTTTHEYNLINRGWTGLMLKNFNDGLKADGSASATGKWPSKNMIPWKALVRTPAAYSLAEIDYPRKFDINKITADPFGTSSAPTGSLLVNPYDLSKGYINSTGYNISGGTTGISLLATAFAIQNRVEVAISGRNEVKTDVTFRVTVTSTGALAVNDKLTLSGFKFKFRITKIPVGYYKSSFVKFEGLEVIVTAKTATTFDFVYSYYGGRLDSSTLENVTLGQAQGFASFPRPGGVSVAQEENNRPQATCFYAGRLFLAGFTNVDMSDVVMFSQLTTPDKEGHLKYGKMYQEGDPTSEFYSQLVPTDGGTIQIPGLGKTLRMESLGNSLLLFSKNGIWELSGGNQGFSATNYQVRKMAEIEIASAYSVVYTDIGMIVASARGAYLIGPEEQTGRLNMSSLTFDTIQTIWNNIPKDSFSDMQLIYDTNKYKLHILYYQNNDTLNRRCIKDTDLIFDARQRAWTKNTFDQDTSNYIMGGIYQNTSANKEVKYFATSLEGNGLGVINHLRICDFNNNQWEDFNNVEKPAYLEFSYTPKDTSYAKKKQAPLVVVYQKDKYPNPCSIILESRWDTPISELNPYIMSEQETFRPKVHRYGSLTNNRDFDIQISKNKVRGKGRILNLRLSSSEEKDAHLIGYSILYQFYSGGSYGA